LLKGNVTYSKLGRAKKVVDGKWTDRIKKYEQLFGPAPKILSAEVNELEWIRETRNGVGHAFGRGMKDYDIHSHMAPVPMTLLEEPKLLECLKLVMDVGKAVDQALAFAHIGEYEIIHYFHKRYGSRSFGKNPKWTSLKKEIGTLYEVKVSKNFCEGLERYYAAV
jgi:hypothetical protein